MNRIEDIGHELAELAGRYDADYIEARLEESQSSHITYRGRELESIGRATAIGGNVRALVNGGWGFISFDNFAGLADKVERAVKQARFVGSEVSQLAPVNPVIRTVAQTPSPNPVVLPLADKRSSSMNTTISSGAPRRYRPL